MKRLFVLVYLFTCVVAYGGGFDGGGYTDPNAAKINASNIDPVVWRNAMDVFSKGELATVSANLTGSNIVAPDAFRTAIGGAKVAGDPNQTFYAGDIIASSITAVNTGAQPKFFVYHSTTQSITQAGTGAGASFTAELYDTQSTVEEGVFTCPVGQPGLYLFTTTITFPAGGTDGAQCYANILHEGNVRGGGWGTLSNGVAKSAGGPALIYLAGGNKVWVNVYHNSAGPLNLVTDGTTPYCSFAGARLY